MALLEIKNLNFKYHNTTINALNDVNLEIEAGEFVVLCGETGCGKTTLLKLLKKQMMPNGTSSGEILYDNIPIKDLDERRSVCEIGYVQQNPSLQIVTDKVWHELAFGLESLGEKTEVIRRKVAEVSGYFGITDWYHKKTSELSGGQKQLLNLASIMAMEPKVLILDEPTSQLDPITASEFINTLRKINEELGMTIILVEHRLEEVYPIADKIVMMEKAKVLFVDSPKNVTKKLLALDRNHKMTLALPTAARIYTALGKNEDCPLTVKEGKKFINTYFDTNIKTLKKEEKAISKTEVLSIKEGFFRYERETPDILKGVDVKVFENEFLCILGANGAGKTTLLKILNGTNRLYRGKLRIFGKKLSEYKGVSLYRNNLATLPQNPQILFTKNTVYEDLEEVTKIMEYDKDLAKEKIDYLVKTLEIEHVLNQHPYDLSGGEQQKVAFAKILLMEPKIVFLDEPTKGLDAYSKISLARLLKNLQNEGKTIVMVTHDIEFSALYADRCAMFFDGQIVSSGTPTEFFANNNYYTTAANRISKNIFDKAITVDDVVELCNLNGRKQRL